MREKYHVCVERFITHFGGIKSKKTGCLKLVARTGDEKSINNIVWEDKRDRLLEVTGKNFIIIDGT